MPAKRFAGEPPEFPKESLRSPIEIAETVGDEPQQASGRLGLELRQTPAGAHFLSRLPGDRLALQRNGTASLRKATASSKNLRS
jgi:hypothetical protein